MPKERLLGKSYHRNQIYLHWTKPKNTYRLFSSD